MTGKRIMGLDVGTKYIGVAVSDETRSIAQGRGRLLRGKDADTAERLRAVAEKDNVDEIVVGLPLNMNGTRGPRADDSVRFAEMLEKALGLPVRLWDERLSTKECEDIMIKASMTRKKRKKVIDKAAAQIILQGYLDSLE